MDDTRLEWLGQSLNAALGVPTKTYLEFLNEDRHEDRIDDFLNARLTSIEKDDNTNITNLFFYAIKGRRNEKSSME